MWLFDRTKSQRLRQYDDARIIAADVAIPDPNKVTAYSYLTLNP